MGYFNATIAAALAGRTVRMALLVHFDFATTPMRVWSGFGDLAAGGYTWSGLGELGSISGIESAIGGTAPQVTFSMSGIDAAVVTATLNASDEVTGRDATIFAQFFDEDWQTLDSPYALWAGTMDVMRFSRADVTSRVVALTAETLFARRGIPAFGYLSPADQEGLFAGDRFLEQVPTMANKSVQWPAF
jgi:hypothetical protein